MPKAHPSRYDGILKGAKNFECLGCKTHFIGNPDKPNAKCPGCKLPVAYWQER